MSFTVVNGINKKSLQTTKEPLKSNSGVSKNLDNKNSTGSTHPLIYLQKAIGNQAVQKLTRSNAPNDFEKITFLAKLKVSQPSDVYEQEADRVAEQVTRLLTPTVLTSTIPQDEVEQISRKCSDCEIKKEVEDEKLNISRKPPTKSNFEANDEVTNEINNTRSSGGSPLDASTKEFMGSRLATHDFSNVRVHTNEMAARSAKSVNAFAYTIGNDIVFDEGRYKPDTLEGRRLLAHELTHVIQQSDTAITTTTIQRQRRMTSPESPMSVVAPGSSPTLEPPSTIAPSSPEMTTTNPSATAEEYIDFEGFRLTRRPDQIYHELWPIFQNRGRAGITDFARRFEESIKTDKEIERGTPSYLNGSYVYFIHDQYIDQAAMRIRILTKERVLPVLQTQIIRIREEPTIASLDLENIDRLADAHPLYRAVRDYKEAAYRLSRSSPYEAQFEEHRQARDFTLRIMELELKAQGFPNLEEFNKAVVSFEHFFQRYALQTAFSMLAANEKLAQAEYARYGGNALTNRDLHDLKSKLRQYAIQRGREAELYNQIEKTLKGSRAFNRASVLEGAKLAKEMRLTEQLKLELFESYPVLLDPAYTKRMYDLDFLSYATPEELSRRLRGTAGEVLEKIAIARQDLLDDPEDIWHAEQAMQHARQSLGIQPDSIYQTIIDDKLKRIKRKERLRNLFLAALAIGFGLMTLGTGAVAVAGYVGAAAVGVVSVASHVQEYKRAQAFAGSAFDRAKSLSAEDPSFAWLALDIAFAILDLGSAVRAFRAVKPVVKTFNETGDWHKLNNSLKTLSEIDDALAGKVIDSLIAERKYEKAIEEIGSAFRSVLYSTFIPYGEKLAEWILRAFQYLKHKGVKGAIDVKTFLLQLKKQKVIGEIKELTATELSIAENALEEAQRAVKMTDDNILNYPTLHKDIRQTYPVQEMEGIGRYGLHIGMEREEIAAFLKMGSESGLKRKTLKELEVVMEKWVATKRSGIPWGFSNPEHFNEFKQLVKSGIDNTNYKDMKALLQGSSVKGISYELKIPFGPHSDLDIALAGRSMFERAQKLASEGLIGPASANPTKFLLKDGDEGIKMLGLESLHNSLKRSAGRNVDFMLFRSEHNAREYARRSVGPNSVELN